MVEAIGVNASVTFNGREISIITKDSTRIILRDALTGLDCGQANDLGYVTLIANGQPSTVFFDRKELLVMARLVAAIKGVSAPVASAAPVRVVSPAPVASKPKKPWTIKRVAIYAFGALCVSSAVMAAIPQSPEAIAAAEARRAEQQQAAIPAEPTPEQIAREQARRINSENISQVTATKRQVRQLLRDPSSVRFGEVRVVRDGDGVTGAIIGVCGVYNARNGYGGMSGDQMFIVDLTNHTADLEGVTEAQVKAKC